MQTLATHIYIGIIPNGSLNVPEWGKKWQLQSLESECKKNDCMEHSQIKKAVWTTTSIQEKRCYKACVTQVAKIKNSIAVLLQYGHMPSILYICIP